MKKVYLAAALIIALSVFPYANAFQNEFVWDERVFVEENVKVRALENIPSFFGQTEFGLYRPLRTTLYALTYAVWGQNPFGYHVNAVFWHALASLLVFAIVRALAKGMLVPVMTAAIFAVHPVHTERVTNMTGGFDLLGIVLLLAAFYCYVLFAQQQRKKWLGLSIAFFALGLFASEEVMTLPLLVVLYEWLFNGFRVLQQKKVAGLFAGMLAAFAAFRFFVIRLSARAAEYPAGTLAVTMLTMGKAVFYYLLLAFFPFRLTLYREVETVSSVLDGMFLLAVVVVMATVIAAVKCRKRQPLLSFAMFWFFITLLPFSNFLPLQSLMADRYLYVPSLGAALLYALLVKRTATVRKAAGLTMAAVVVLGFAALTVERNTDWRDDVTLWETAAGTSPNTSTVFSNLGFAYEQTGEYGKAGEALDRAIELDRGNAKAYYNRGIVRLKEKKYEAAVEDFGRAVEHDEGYVKAYDGLGLSYYYWARESGKDELLAKAGESLRQAVAVDPAYSKAHSDLGIVYGQLGRFAEAEREFRAAITLNPRNHEAYFNMGILQEFFGEQEAAANFRKAYELQPESEQYRHRAAGSGT